MTAVNIVEADLGNPLHQRATEAMVDAYSRDPMGDAQPLPPEIRAALVPGLRAHPTTLIFLAFAGDTPIGGAICFLGFSTFKAKPLINIHDLVVVPGQRGLGIGARLIAAVADKGRALGCCKLTLEVFENNHRARQVYEKAGFVRAAYQEAAGGALFLAKPL